MFFVLQAKSVEIHPIISTHYKGKSSSVNPNKKIKWHKNKTGGLPREIADDKELQKYWYKRYSLFSLYDRGIKLDKGKL